MKTQIQLPIPILLNELYIPGIKNGKPFLRKNPEAKKYVELVKIEAIRQKVKYLKSKKLSFKMDILIKDRKDYDIDAVEKLTLDALEGIAYINDKYIIEKISRKHLKAEDDKLIIQIETIED